jgi:5-formyltetrahydrofolate cyclo-ligase
VTTPASPGSASSAAASSKAQLRRQCLLARRALADRAAAADAVAAALGTLLARVPAYARRHIAGYYPLGEELDSRPAMAALSHGGLDLLLPVTLAQGDCLLFRQWKAGAPLVPGPFGTFHPPPSAPLGEPSIILVPLLGFDLTGHRLGYGAGFYDRTLAAVRKVRPVLAVGLAFDAQEIPQVPAEPNDQRLDAVVTERRTLCFAAHPLLPG